MWDRGGGGCEEKPCEVIGEQRSVSGRGRREPPRRGGDGVPSLIQTTTVGLKEAVKL